MLLFVLYILIPCFWVSFWLWDFCSISSLACWLAYLKLLALKDFNWVIDFLAISPNFSTFWAIRLLSVSTLSFIAFANSCPFLNLLANSAGIDFPFSFSKNCSAFSVNFLGSLFKKSCAVWFIGKFSSVFLVKRLHKSFFLGFKQIISRLSQYT